MTRSEQEWEQILKRNQLGYQYEPGQERKKRPDFRFTLDDGNPVYCEVKQCEQNRLDQEITSRVRSGWWGAREGADILRPNGRVDRTGWGGHFLDAADQLKEASMAGHQTLVVFRSYSLSASLDGTDILLFLFGYHYEDLGSGRFRFLEDRWLAEDAIPPMASFNNFEHVGGLVHLRNDGFYLYANPFSRNQIRAEPFAKIAGCFGVYDLQFAARFHAIWEKWEAKIDRDRLKLVRF